MTNKKVTRRALLMSVTSLLICISMLLGTTFAWFTDEVTSGVNQIVAGNLDVELDHNTMTNGEFATNDSAVSTSEYLFKSEAGGDKMLWEPGAMAIEKLTVKNVGTLALKYKLNFSIKGYNTVGGKDLSDVIKAYVTDTAPTTRSVDGLTAADLDAFSKEGTLTAGAAAAPNTETFYVILYWAPNDNDVDNQYNLKNGLKADDGSDKLYIDLGVNLVAGQLQSEVDSFDKTYDENATYPVGINTLSKTVVSAAKSATGDTTLTSGLVTAKVPTSENTLSLTDESNQPITTDESTEFTLTVEPTTAAAATVAVTTNTDNADYYDISLAATTTTTTGDDTSTVTKNVKNSSEIITVNLNIGTGLTDVVVYHGTEQMTAAGTTPAADTFAYDANTGILTLYVKSFSPFVIGYNAPVAAIGSTNYATLVDAVKAVGNNQTINLLRDASGAGIFLAATDNKNFTVDFNGHTYTCSGPAVGSSGTQTQAWHLEKDNTVVLKNGTVNSTTDSGVKMLIQNYCNLTLTDMTIDGTKLVSGRYVVSNNSGNVVINGKTSIMTPSNGVAFDVYYWPSGSYTNGPKVTVNTTGTIQGIIEVARDKSSSLPVGDSKSSLTITAGTFTGSFNIVNGYQAFSSVSITGGTFSSDPTDYVADGYMVNKENDLFTVISEADKAVKLAKAAGATDVAKSGTGAIGTMSDNVKYYWNSDGTVYVYDATNYNGYYGEETKDETTYYVGKLVDVKGFLAAFNGNTNIKKLVIYKDIDYAFKSLANNTSITTIEYASGTTRLNNRIAYQSSVTSIILPSTITTLEESAIQQATNLTSITLPEGITSIPNNFAYASGLTSINIPSTVTSIGETAFAATGITTVSIPASVTAIGNYAFRNCKNLTTAYIYGENVEFPGGKSMVFAAAESANVNNPTTVYVKNDTVKNNLIAASTTQTTYINNGSYVITTTWPTT